MDGGRDGEFSTALSVLFKNIHKVSRDTGLIPSTEFGFKKIVYLDKTCFQEPLQKKVKVEKEVLQNYFLN